MKKIKFALIALIVALGISVGHAQTVNINTADAETLASALDGVGAQRAEAIVQHRDQHGAFHSADDLVQVQGIGAATVENNRDRITVE